MSEDVRARAELLRLIVEGHFPLEPLRAELASYPWDADEPLVTVSADHVRQVLERYVRGELSMHDVQGWAEALEVREDVGFDDVDQPDIRRVIFMLANPDLNEQLTPERARQLLGQLEHTP